MACHYCVQISIFRLSEVDHFQKVLEHAAFKEDPLSAISEHISNSVAKNFI